MQVSWNPETQAFVPDCPEGCWPLRDTQAHLALCDALNNEQASVTQDKDGYAVPGPRRPPDPAPAALFPRMTAEFKHHIVTSMGFENLAEASILAEDQASLRTWLLAVNLTAIQAQRELDDGKITTEQALERLERYSSF